MNTATASVVSFVSGPLATGEVFQTIDVVAWSSSGADIYPPTQFGSTYIGTFTQSTDSLSTLVAKTQIACTLWLATHGVAVASSSVVVV